MYSDNTHHLPSDPLHILHLEDEPNCSKLLQRELNGSGICCKFSRVDNRTDFVKALESGAFDLILSDYYLPAFDGSTALVLAREKAPDLPFIFVTGASNEHTVAELVKEGATDCVIKPNISMIAPAVLRAIGEAALRQERNRAKARLAAIQQNCLLLPTDLDLADIMQSILRKIDTLLPEAAAAIGLVDNVSAKIQPIACHRIDKAQWRASFAAARESLESEIVESRQLRVVLNLQSDSALSANHFYRTQGFVSCIGAPIAAFGETVGALVILAKFNHDFTDEEIEFVKILAAQAGLAAYHSQLHLKYHQFADELKKKEIQISDLRTGLFNAQDEVAKRIAHVLHDESGQLLATVYIKLDETAKTLPAPARVEIAKAKVLLDQVEHRLRDLSHELYPATLEDLGLMPSLKSLAEQIFKRRGIAITVESHLAARLRPNIELILYRVIQEALNNTVRHSRAAHARVKLWADTMEINCFVGDDGVGFHVAEATRAGSTNAALGIRGMHERIAAVDGKLEILSAPGRGTEVMIKIPTGGR
jgi:signal transduction histidine kinase